MQIRGTTGCAYNLKFPRGKEEEYHRLNDLKVKLGIQATDPDTAKGFKWNTSAWEDAVVVQKDSNGWLRKDTYTVLEGALQFEKLSTIKVIIGGVEPNPKLFNLIFHTNRNVAYYKTKEIELALKSYRLGEKLKAEDLKTNKTNLEELEIVEKLLENDENYEELREIRDVIETVKNDVKCLPKSIREFERNIEIYGKHIESIKDRLRSVIKALDP